MQAALSPVYHTFRSVHHGFAVVSFLLMEFLEDVSPLTAGIKELEAINTWVQNEAMWPLRCPCAIDDPTRIYMYPRYGFPC